MKNKILSLALSTALAVGIITPVTAEKVTSISGGSVSVKPGEEFVMPVYLDNGEGIQSITLELSSESKYITPVKNSLTYRGEGDIQAIQIKDGNEDKIVILAENINASGEDYELFSYSFKAAEDVEKAVTTSVYISLDDSIADISTVNGVVSINAEPAPTAEQTPVPEEPQKTPEPTPEIEKTPEPTKTPTPKKDREISLSGISDKQYGDSPFELEFSADASAVNEDVKYSSDNENVAVVNSDGLVTIVGAGVCNISASIPENDEYNEAEASAELTVNKKVLTVYPNDLTITYGEELPDNLVAFDGFLNEEDEDILSKQVVVSGLPEDVEPGTYTLTLSGIESENYKINYLSGTLKINKKDLNITSLKAFDKIADGTKTAYIDSASIVLDGVNEGDDVNVDTTYATAEFAQAEAGENIEVSVENLILSGKDAYKYNLVSNSFKTNANVVNSMTAAQMAATVTGIEKLSAGQQAIRFPNVGSGFTIAIFESSDEEVISLDGNISKVKEDTAVTLVFVVSSGEEVAYTTPIQVTVPKSKTITVTQAEMIVDLDGTGTYFVGDEVTVSLPSHYKTRRWFANGSRVGLSSVTTSYTFIAEEDVEIEADPYFHMGGSLASNVVSRVTSNISSSKKVVSGTSVELSTATDKAVIYYTTDGSIPTTSSKKYTGEIIIDENVTIKAIAVKSGMNKSSVTTFNYTVRQAETELKDNANKIRYMAAYADNTFRPDQSATRYEVINALNEILDIEDVSGNKTFSDVDEEYRDIVLKFANVGIISGYENGTFGGNRSITRAEFVTLLTKAWNFKESSSSSAKFNDTYEHWAEDIIGTFASKGYVSGYPDGGFHPDDKVTRAEVVSVINRMIGTKSVASSQKYVDLAPTHWAYSQIMAVVA